jgi:hypothetical protein
LALITLVNTGLTKSGGFTLKTINSSQNYD